MATTAAANALAAEGEGMPAALQEAHKHGSAHELGQRVREHLPGRLP